MKQIITVVFAALGLTVLLPLSAYAHVVVTPKQATVGQSTPFSISVPNEREEAVTKLKITIPDGVKSVQPDVMAGWAITTEKSGENVTSITWTGEIPSGQRADFEFKAKLPGKTGDVQWKAYQTYADGVTVSWDQAPTAEESDSEDATTGPYSVTNVTEKAEVSEAQVSSGSETLQLAALILSIVAIVLAVGSLAVRSRK